MTTFYQMIGMTPRQISMITSDELEGRKLEYEEKKGVTMDKAAIRVYKLELRKCRNRNYAQLSRDRKKQQDRITYLICETLLEENSNLSTERVVLGDRIKFLNGVNERLSQKVEQLSDQLREAVSKIENLEGKQRFPQTLSCPDEVLGVEKHFYDSEDRIHSPISDEEFILCQEGSAPLLPVAEYTF